MPTKIRMDDYGDFVHSPESPVTEEWAEYIAMADRLLQEHGRAQQACLESPFVAELADRKRQLDAYLSDFAALFKDKYTISPVEHDPRFLHLSRFLAEHQPVRDLFSVLHCNLDLPLHTVREFQTFDDLESLSAALAEDTPLRWWRNGPMDRPCYLFGRWIWELKPSEVTASEDGLALLFAEVAEQARHKHGRLTHDAFSNAATATVEAVSKNTRIAVFRRDHGKCAKCGSHDQIDFEYIVPLNKGGSDTPQNVHLLCGKCRR